MKETNCKNCKYCYYAKGEDVTRGNCKRYPTQVSVSLKSWCGEFKAK